MTCSGGVMYCPVLASRFAIPRSYNRRRPQFLLLRFDVGQGSNPGFTDFKWAHITLTIFAYMWFKRYLVSNCGWYLSVMIWTFRWLCGDVYGQRLQESFPLSGWTGGPTWRGGLLRGHGNPGRLGYVQGQWAIQSATVFTGFEPVAVTRMLILE